MPMATTAFRLRPLASTSSAGPPIEPEEVLAGAERQDLPCQAVRTNGHDRILRDTKGLFGEPGGAQPIAHLGGKVGFPPGAGSR
jgi:hypothetical protein